MVNTPSVHIIHGRPKTVRELLNDVKYELDYYQREYRWETKHVSTLLTDLESKFLEAYDRGDKRKEVQSYPHYFLGSVIVCEKDARNLLIDGQQRLTTLTLLLIYLKNLQGSRSDKVDVGRMIFSERYGEKSFNLHVPERSSCMDVLYRGESFDETVGSESVRNMVARYSDIEELFPESLKGDALPFFIDWLVDNVDLVEIKTYSDDDAYTIFETMNDRGLILSPTDMLKGYLLSKIEADGARAGANDLWRTRVLELIGLGKDEEKDFFKAWLRAKYATTIRQRERGAKNEDFERIGAAFHKWVREEHSKMGLDSSEDYQDFIVKLFHRFSEYYMRVRRAASRFTPGMEYVFYNDRNSFTLQYPLILSPLLPNDDERTTDAKIRLVAGYIDIFIARRLVNFRPLSYSSVLYTMFNLMKEIRDLDAEMLAELLKSKVEEMEDKFDAVPRFHLRQQNRRSVQYLLARMTHHVEQQSGLTPRFEDYISRSIRNPYQIEHLWAENSYHEHDADFRNEDEFKEYRNRMGGLILLPKDFNQSYGDKPYAVKVEAYFAHNLLARTLNPKCYQNNPSFLSYRERSGLPFEPFPTQLTKTDLDARSELYRRICDEIWSPSRFENELALLRK